MQPTITTDELLSLLESTPDLVVLDVRTAEEVADWSLPKVCNIPVEELATRLDEVPRGCPLAVLCLRGRRSQEAGVILETAGIHALVVEGGMSAWGRTLAVAEIQVGLATVVQLRRLGKGCLSYLIGVAGHCLVIDPSGDLARLEGEIARRQWVVTAVLDTHLHADHLSLARQLATRHRAAVIMNDDGYDFAVMTAEPGTRIEIAEGIGVQVRATPGHTEGASSFLLDGGVLLSGDPLFVESVGRPDLANRAEEFAHQLYRSLHEELALLEDDTLVLPAHMGAKVEVIPGDLVGVTLGELRGRLEAFRLGEKDFVAWAAGQAVEWPPNYHAIVEANRGLAEPSPEEAMELELGPNRCAVASTPTPIGG